MRRAFYSWSDPQIPNGCGCMGFLSPMRKKIPGSYSKREGGNPGNSTFVSTIHGSTLSRAVWTNCYAEQEVTSKTYN